MGYKDYEAGREAAKVDCCDEALGPKAVREALFSISTVARTKDTPEAAWLRGYYDLARSLTKV